MEEKALSILADVTERVRYYARRNIADWLKLGEALTEAKGIVPRGEWDKYLQENAGMSRRMCENCMNAFRRFGTSDPEITRLNMSQVIALLPGSDEEIAKISEGGDIGQMSSREIQKAIRAAREEEQQKARESLEAVQQGKVIELARQKENADRALADALEKARLEKEEEIRVRTAHRDEQIDAQKAQIEALQAEAETLRRRAEEAESQARDATEAAIAGAKDVSLQSSRMEAEARRLREELADKDAMIQELQEQYDSLRDEYTDVQSAAARGDAERTNTDILSAESVGDAARVFIGQVGRIPFMHGAFAAMDELQRDEYRATVLQIKEWADKSLDAINAVRAEGGIY